MAKTPPNHRKEWTSADDKAFAKLNAENTPTRVMALKLGRTPEAIYGHASELGVSLKPTNQRPYNRRKP
jgi:hypothetical protein